MGERAATTELITKLVSLLGDENPFVRAEMHVLSLVRMSEKAATTEVMTKLVSLLGDENPSVSSECMCLLWEVWVIK